MNAFPIEPCQEDFDSLLGTIQTKDIIVYFLLFWVFTYQWCLYSCILQPKIPKDEGFFFPLFESMLHCFQVGDLHSPAFILSMNSMKCPDTTPQRISIWVGLLSHNIFLIAIQHESKNFFELRNTPFVNL